jgi:Tfp pilus assembly protein PilO
MNGAWANLRYASRQPWVRAGLVCAVVALVALIVAAALVWSARSQVVARQAELTQKAQTLREAGQAQELLTVFTRVSADVTRIEGKLDYAATQGQLVQDFAELAARHQLSILNQSYEEGRRNGSLQALATELSVRGSYRAIRGFLLDVPQLRAWTEVREVSLERSRDAGMIDGKIVLATFRRAGEGT